MKTSLFTLPKRVFIISSGSVVGQKEKHGPLGSYFDLSGDDKFGKDTWEKSEAEMQRLALGIAMRKAEIEDNTVDVLFAGDLINQCISSSYGLLEYKFPFLGLFGACSTCAEGLLMSAVYSSTVCDRCAAVTSSHYCSAERQFRYPLEYGGQRTPTSQWTVTGSGAALICSQGNGPKITACTIGTVTDYGIKDANNMGAAMAPAALKSIRAHFDDLHCSPTDFDLIVTGDLGQTGKELLMELARKDGISLGGKITDCGTLIFDNTTQDVHSGGSGCGCSAITLCGYLLEQLRGGKLKKILFCGTGALLSPTSTQQGLPIPGVCHAVSIEGGR